MDAPELENRPILAEAWRTMPAAMQRTVTTAPTIPQIAARAKAAAATHPEMVRGDQGQVVDVLPEREIYYGPSSGMPELRDLVARFWTLAYRLQEVAGIPQTGLGPHHVAIVSGATEGIAILMRMLAPERSIGVQRLHWGNYRNIIGHAGGETIVIDFLDGNGHFDADGIVRAVDAGGIRTLLVNFPANPTGDVLTDDEMRALAAIARDHELILIADEVYNWIRYDDQPRSMLAFAPERTIVIGAASKEYLIPGARTGYVISCDEVFCNEWMPRLIRATSSSPNILGQQLAVEMLAADVADLEAGRHPSILGQIKAELRRRRDALAEVLEAAGCRLVTRDGELPRGGISLLARLPEDQSDDAAVLDTAIRMGRFSAIPGSSFGAPGCLRFGYAGMPVEGIARLREFLPEVLDRAPQP